MLSSDGTGQPDDGLVPALGKPAGQRDLAGGIKPEFPPNMGDCDRSRPVSVSDAEMMKLVVHGANFSLIITDNFVHNYYAD